MSAFNRKRTLPSFLLIGTLVSFFSVCPVSSVAAGEYLLGDAGQSLRQAERLYNTKKYTESQGVILASNGPTVI